MIDFRKHEQLEMEILKELSDAQILNSLIFGGGTALRLCFGLKRYSVDLDFWKTTKFTKKAFLKIKKVLKKKYEITDFHEKHFSYLLELRAKDYKRRLKIEIRKKTPKNAETELNIAFSKFSNEQVRVTTFTMRQMWMNKVDALLERQEIRDAYDLEFLYKKGYGNFDILAEDKSERRPKGILSKSDTANKSAISKKEKLVAILQSWKNRDFKVTLGSVLEPEERDYYTKYGFKILRSALK